MNRWMACLFLLVPLISLAAVNIKPTVAPSSPPGLERLVLTVMDMPKGLLKCGGKEDVTVLLTKRFASEKGAPKLGKGEDPALPLLEFWVETREESPKLFAGLAVPAEMTAMVPRMRITVFPKAEPGSEEKPTPEIAFEGNGIWWGEEKGCKEGLTKAVNAVLDRFFAEFWRAERT